jgi:hypothetical protein
MYRANALFAVSPVLVVAFLPAPGPGGMEEKGDSGNRHFLLHNSLRMIAAGYALILVLIVPHAIASGIHWGARLLLPVYPLLGVLAASGIARWWSSSRNLPTALHALPVLLLLLSIALQCYGLRLLHDRKDVTARLNEAVARRSERVIVVDDKLFLPDLASLFYERILVLLADREATIRLPELITRVGEERALFVLTGDPGETPEALGEVVADPRHFVSYHLRSVELPPHGR